MRGLDEATKNTLSEVLSAPILRGASHANH